MRSITIPWKAILCCSGLVCLILDSRCAAQAAAQAIRQCIGSVIPALFPMLVLSGYALPVLTRLPSGALSRLCRIPRGSEGIFWMGLLGGFPIGAQCIARASLTREDAQRMLGFCNNCGPAFLFGIIGSFFQRSDAAFALFIIQALAALCVGCLWRDSPGGAGSAVSLDPVGFAQAVQGALRSMASICAWVILANVVLAFFHRWFMPFWAPEVCVILSGMLELTSGCLMLPQIRSESVRFLAASILICFGGGCVMLQIHAMVCHLRLSLIPCILQKALQGVLGIILGIAYLKWGWAALPAAFFTILLGKKAVEKSAEMLYNGSRKGGNPYAVSQTN